ncbi:MAG TPA: hypothetical protein VME63_04890 [Dyella sp.]|uniref:hypothetical protein n=1 Tax=Dyella sp. TaxID=1869338 RepID=UPI002CDC89E8|nr:hypothetical protein [Dyella sp.]HTV84716.1 hypothetical protein [Dyella sp.]
MKLLWVALAVLLNVSSQLLIKSVMRSVNADGLSSLLRVFFTPLILLAVFFYGLSFLLTMKVFQAFPLARIVPIMAAATFVLVAVSSTRLFGEIMTSSNWLGVLFIICGIALVVAR